MNFVFVSLQRINTDRESTSTSLAKELARNHKVLYVNPPIDRRTLLSGSYDQYTAAHIDSIKRKRENLTVYSENLSILNPSSIIESVNWIPFTSVFLFFMKMNNRRFANDIKKAIKRLGFKEFILVNDKDMFRSFFLKEFLNPSLSVYLDRDYTLGFDYWKRHGFTVEPALMKKSDLVVCNSLDFTKRAAGYNKNSFYIGNGADLEVFDVEKEWNFPDELKSLRRPLIGYVGALNSQRIDIELIRRIAEARKNWSFVFIGEEDAEFKNSVLHSLTNVYFIEKKHTSVIPAYVKQFDVCINPQLINEITIGNFPLKIIEYLAMGRPVVATATNTMKEVFGDITYLAVTVEEYVSVIEKAMADDSEEEREERIRFSRRYSWTAVASEFLSAIAKVSTGRSGV